MENCSTDTLSSLKHLPGLRLASSSFSASQPSFNLAPHSVRVLWHPAGDLQESRFIALYSEADYSHINFVRDHGQQARACNLLCRDPTRVYPSPPSGSSSKTTIPLPEENGEYHPVYSTQVLGVLDSPTVMRREDLASHIPLTPPPTLPHSTLALPDADVDVEFEEEGDKGLENEYDEDEPCCGESETSSHSADTDSPLSPLSPTWDSHCPSERALSVALVQEIPSGSEQIHSFWSPVATNKALPDQPLAYSDDVSPYASPPTPFSLLEIDAPRPVLAPISIPWSPHQSYDIEHDSPPSPMSNAWPSPPRDGLSPPSSPLISRLDLPVLPDDDEMPHIIPSSPSRRSCSDLPDTDIEMSHFSQTDAPASPSQTLLSLPGAETDDDLLPAISPSSPPAFVPFPTGQRLLFIDDPQDVPLPRSPSPEDFDVPLSPEIADPEFSKLYDLQKRFKNAEAHAGASDVEARKTRKRERERCKEVRALLRLKLDRKVGTSNPETHEEQQLPQPQPQGRQSHRRRGVISSMSQLVAQMVFRRNDTSRPLKTSTIPRQYIRSSLSHTVAG